MGKRPLCLLASLLVLFLWLTPEDARMKNPDIPSGERVRLTGVVAKREQLGEKQGYLLKDCRCSRSKSFLSVFAYTKTGESYPIGCTLSLDGTIYQLEQADNPGQFDAEQYYQGRGILYTFQSESEQIVSLGFAPVREAAASLREYMAAQLGTVYGERDAGILRAVLLADKSGLREEDKLLYQKNGIAHLLAISGLHISMIGISLYRLLRKTGVSFLVSGLFSGTWLLFYGVMTGFGISTIRAVCMFLVTITAEVVGRTYDMASALALAALIIGVRSPLQVRQAGFLLSFGAVLGICAVYPALQKVFPEKGKLSGALLFSLSVSLVTAPLSVHFYYEYPLYSTLLNLIVIPCMPFVMGFGALGMIGGIASPSLGSVLGLPAHFLLSFYELLGKGTLKLPFAVLTAGCEQSWQLTVYYLLLAGTLIFLYRSGKRRFLFGLLAAVFVIGSRFRGGVTFTMLDVGQGDGLFLRFPGGTTCLIDGGSTSEKHTGRYRILPYLKYEGVGELDYVIFSHMDADHTNGAEELLQTAGTLEGIRIGTVLFPASAEGDKEKERLSALAKEKKIKVGTIGAGDRLDEGEASLCCLFPARGKIYADKNDGSLALFFNYRQFQLLLTGDLGFAGEAELLRAGTLAETDVWKVSHHGSNHSGSAEFLARISPQVSLISVGANNRYGHPGTELLDRLLAAGSKVYATAQSGALTIRSDGEDFTLSLQRKDDSCIIGAA